MERTHDEFLKDLRAKLDEADELLETDPAEYIRLYDPPVTPLPASTELLSDEGPF